MVHFQQKMWDYISKFKVVGSDWAEKTDWIYFPETGLAILELLGNTALKTFRIPLSSLLFSAAPVWFHLPASWTSLRLFPWCLRSGICCFISSLPLGSSYQFFMLTMAKAAIDCCILTVSLFNFKLELIIVDDLCALKFVLITEGIHWRISSAQLNITLFLGDVYSFIENRKKWQGDWNQDVHLWVYYYLFGLWFFSFLGFFWEGVC